MSNRAEYMRDYRALRKMRGKPVPRGGKQSGQKLSKFKRGEFIAWDGEGVTTDVVIDEHTNQHNYILLANSVGHTIIADTGSYIPSIKLLDCLLDCALQYPNAIHVVYGGSYDMNHILRDLDKDTAKELSKTGECKWNGYTIKFRPRRSLYIRKGETFITLWDVIGFFQMPFAKAVEQWLGADYGFLETIKSGKHLRKSFSMADIGFMQEYNDKELQALVTLMQRFSHSVTSLELSLSRWDGAGSVAASIFQKTNFKKTIKVPYPEIELAARHAYFGGRFELGQYGYHQGVSYGYDINSAYPTAFLGMPSLANGHWEKLSRNSPGFDNRITDFSLVRIYWNLPRIRFGPFPYRDYRGLVLFPEKGSNWVWGSEYRAWLDIIPDYPDWVVEAEEAWIFCPHSQELPFKWVESYYQQRQHIVNGISELPYGCQMVIKLGLNSLYGKTAQNLGYDPQKGTIPPYHSLLYAGYITAKTRAQLWRAAMQAPDNIVMMATDGIISTAPLDLPISDSKELGKWESQIYDSVCAIQSGVYITEQQGNYKFKKRGLDSDDNVRVFLDRVIGHWQNTDTRYTKLSVPQTRLIGIKSAVLSDEFWSRWGCWYNQDFELLMHPGPQTKRTKDKNDGDPTPHSRLCKTMPSYNFMYDIANEFSFPYERPWDRRNWKWNDEEEIAEITDYEWF